MTTTETETPPEDVGATPSGGAPPPVGPSDPPALEAGPDPRREALWTRAILPLALPLLAALATAIWVINLSRAFLAGGKQGALVIVLIVTVSIMAGAALMSAAPRMRSSSRLMIVATFLTLIVAVGIVTLGFSEEHGEAGGGGYLQPKGPAVATVEVDALPSIKFQAKQFTTTAGVNLIKYNDKGGTHTLAFDTTDPNLRQFLLHVPPNDQAKADLKPGKYTVYCTIPGHRAQGMEATITVTAATAAPTTTTAPG